MGSFLDFMLKFLLKRGKNRLLFSSASCYTQGAVMLRVLRVGSRRGPVSPFERGYSLFPEVNVYGAWIQIKKGRQNSLT